MSQNPLEDALSIYFSAVKSDIVSEGGKLEADRATTLFLDLGAEMGWEDPDPNNPANKEIIQALDKMNENINKIEVAKLQAQASSPMTNEQVTGLIKQVNDVMETALDQVRAIKAKNADENQTGE